MRNNLHQDGCSTFDSCIRPDLCCPRWRRRRPGKEYVGPWRGNCLNICGTVCCGHAGVCVCSAGYRIQSFILTCLYGKSQSTRFVTELIMASLVAQLVRPRFDSWVRKIPWRRDRLPLQYSWAFLVAQLVKNLPARRETWLWSLGWEDPPEKGKATHSSILAWRIPWSV